MHRAHLSRKRRWVQISLGHKSHADGKHHVLAKIKRHKERGNRNAPKPPANGAAHHMHEHDPQTEDRDE